MGVGSELLESSDQRPQIPGETEVSEYCEARILRDLGFEELGKGVEVLPLNSNINIKMTNKHKIYIMHCRTNWTPQRE